jgi:hypothetical protein
MGREEKKERESTVGSEERERENLKRRVSKREENK